MNRWRRGTFFEKPWQGGPPATRSSSPGTTPSRSIRSLGRTEERSHLNAVALGKLRSNVAMYLGSTSIPASTSNPALLRPAEMPPQPQKKSSAFNEPFATKLPPKATIAVPVVASLTILLNPELALYKPTTVKF